MKKMNLVRREKLKTFLSDPRGQALVLIGATAVVALGTGVLNAYLKSQLKYL